MLADEADDNFLGWFVPSKSDSDGFVGISAGATAEVFADPEFFAVPVALVPFFVLPNGAFFLAAAVTPSRYCLAHGFVQVGAGYSATPCGPVRAGEPVEC